MLNISGASINSTAFRVLVVFAKSCVHISIKCGATDVVHLLGLLTRDAKLWIAHAPWLSERFWSHHGFAILTCIMAWCTPGLSTSGFLRNRWQGKRSRHSRRMSNGQFCVSGKRPMVEMVFGVKENKALHSHFWITYNRNSNEIRALMWCNKISDLGN